LGLAANFGVGYNHIDVAAALGQAERRHAEALIPQVISVMEDAGLVWNQVEAIGVSVGPGSFTGIRVGLAGAQGFAMAQDIPLTGVGSLDILARACYDVCNPFVGERIYAIQDVRRGEVAVQQFQVTAMGLERASEMEIQNVTAPILHTEPFWISGDGLLLAAGMRHDKNRSYCPSGLDRVRALIRLTREDLEANQFHKPIPAYARPANAKPPRAL